MPSHTPAERRKRKSNGPKPRPKPAPKPRARPKMQNAPATPAKAAKILSDGKIAGKPLTPAETVFRKARRRG